MEEKLWRLISRWCTIQDMINKLFLSSDLCMESLRPKWYESGIYLDPEIQENTYDLRIWSKCRLNIYVDSSQTQPVAYYRASAQKKNILYVKMINYLLVTARKWLLSIP